MALAGDQHELLLEHDAPFERRVVDLAADECRVQCEVDDTADEVGSGTRLDPQIDIGIAPVKRRRVSAAIGP